MGLGIAQRVHQLALRQHRRATLYRAEYIAALALFDHVGVLPISAGLGDTDWAEYADSGALVTAMARVGVAAIAVDSYVDAAEYLKAMLKPADVLICCGTGSPGTVGRLVLERDLQRIRVA